MHELDAGLDKVDVMGEMGREVILVTRNAHLASVGVFVRVVLSLK